MVRPFWLPALLATLVCGAACTEAQPGTVDLRLEGLAADAFAGGSFFRREADGAFTCRYSHQGTTDEEPRFRLQAERSVGLYSVDSARGQDGDQEMLSLLVEIGGYTGWGDYGDEGEVDVAFRWWGNERPGGDRAELSVEAGPSCRAQLFSDPRNGFVRCEGVDMVLQGGMETEGEGAIEVTWFASGAAG